MLLTHALTDGMCIKGKVGRVEAYFVAMSRNVPRQKEALFSGQVSANDEPFW